MRKNSLLEHELTLDDVVEQMFEYLIEKKVRQHPFITILSKKQLWFGNGRHFKGAPTYIAAGLRQNAGVKIPSDIQCEKAESHYGYEALKKPWPELNNLTNRVIRNRILKRTLGGKYDDIRILLGRGYIREDGTLDPDQTKGISSYVVFAADPKKRVLQNEWIRNQAIWIKYQIARNIETHLDILIEKKAQASDIVKMNRKLIEQHEWKELDCSIDRTLLPWNIEN